MKYLKRFNESKKSIKDFCEEYLAYLIDEGFECVYYDTLNGQERENKIIDIKNVIYSGFFWKDVKNEILPFLEVCSEKYDINCVKVYTVNQTRDNVGMFVYSDPDMIHKSWDKNTYCGTIEDLIKEKAKVTRLKLMVFSIEFKKEKV